MVLLYCYSNISYACHIKTAISSYVTLIFILNIGNDYFSLKACRLGFLGFRVLAFVIRMFLTTSRLNCSSEVVLLLEVE